MFVKREKKPAETIYLYRCTYPAYKNMYPYSSIKDWEEATCPYSISQFIMNALVGYLKNYRDKSFTEQTLYDSLKEIRIITLSNDQLEKSNNEFLTNVEYIASLSDEYLNYMSKMSGLNKDYRICYLACTAFFRNGGNFPNILEDKVSQILKDYLEMIYGKGNVYVPGYLLTGKDLHRKGKEILKKANAYFCDGVNVQIFDNESIDVNEQLTVLLKIPFVVSGHEYNAVVKMEDWNRVSPDTCPNYVYLTENALAEDGIKANGINDIGLNSMLEKITGAEHIKISPQVEWEICRNEQLGLRNNPFIKYRK